MERVPSTVPVSAVVITLNAERWLEAVLRPLAAFDEVLILDSGSTDRTREIASAFGALWHEHPFDGYGPQKSRAVELAHNDWVLSIDADEILDEDAAEAILAIDWATQDLEACWTVRRRPFVGAREIFHGRRMPDLVVRLFNRRRHTFGPTPVHESIVPHGPVHHLPGSMAHHSHDDLASLFRADYHRLKAAQYRRAGRTTPGAFDLAGRAAWAFFYSLILRRGFLDGPAGVAVALSGAVNAVLGLALAGEPESIQQHPLE